MKLNFRDLKQVKWQLDVDPTETVGSIKTKNAEERGYDESVVQKLIYSGRILKDDEQISTYEIDEEKGFIVCMTSKKKVKKEPVAKVEDKVEHKAETPASEPSATAAAAAASSGATANAAATASGLPAVPESAINSMMEMGYERPVVMTALRLAYNNPDRAVEFLLNGQAQELRERSSGYYEAQTDEAQAGDVPVGEGADDEDAEMDTTDVNLFDSAPRDDAQLTEMPEDIRQLRQLVRENPSIMEPLIQQLAEQNPMLAEAITQNIDSFLGEGEEGDEQYENTGTIEITAEEDEAIGRLVELGFDRNLVIQAYFACDKNENLTANYLFEHGDED